MLSRSPSWKRIENSFSPISLASPSVAATLPAVSEASEVASTPRMSPWTAICWPFLSTRKTILELESTCSRWSVSLICWYSSSYITRSGVAILYFHQCFREKTRTDECSTRRPVFPTLRDLAPPLQRLGHRDLIGILQVAADRQAERKPRRFHGQRPELLRKIEGRRLPFDIRVCGNDHLADASR